MIKYILRFYVFVLVVVVVVLVQMGHIQRIKMKYSIENSTGHDTKFIVSVVMICLQ